MPKCSPLGSAEMKARAMATKDVLSREKMENATILEGLDILQRRAGFRNQRRFAEAIGFTDARYRYIRHNPGAIRLDEIRMIQAYAKRHETNVQFPIMNEERIS